MDVVRGDLTLPETLDECLDGIDAVFLVWVAPPAAVASTLERIVRHTRRIVFLSSPYKTAHPFFQGPQPNPVTALHAEIERLIETSGRPVDVPAARNVRRECPVLVGAADPRRRRCRALAPSRRLLQLRFDERDSPQSRSAPCVRMDGHAGAEYVLTGPQFPEPVETAQETTRASASYGIRSAMAEHCAGALESQQGNFPQW